ncbi:hypothetical protein K0651_01960 [Ornithinimicrobium sp. Arc0846-15]|nr:hypothetical protein [Ornithinimicrobium laminariae]
MLSTPRPVVELLGNLRKAARDGDQVAVAYVQEAIGEASVSDLVALLALIAEHADLTAPAERGYTLSEQLAGYEAVASGSPTRRDLFAVLNHITINGLGEPPTQAQRSEALELRHIYRANLDLAALGIRSGRYSAAAVQQATRPVLRAAS